MLQRLLEMCGVQHVRPCTIDAQHAPVCCAATGVMAQEYPALLGALLCAASVLGEVGYICFL